MALTAGTLVGNTAVREPGRLVPCGRGAGSPDAGFHGAEPPDAASPDAAPDVAPCPRDERRMADAIRALSIAAVEATWEGRPASAPDDPASPRTVPALPMAMADAATALWTRFHKFDAADPSWPDRDRFVLSAGDGAMLLYALLHLTGHAGMGVAELRRFRQIHSPAAGRPAVGEHPGIEATAGPLGQGIGIAVGLALAERLMAARFGRSLVDHRCWAVASGADLAAGVSHEAASLAGQLRLEKLTVLWHDNDGEADEERGAEDALRRFAGYGWAVKRIDGRDSAQLGAALSLALRSKKPMLIAVRAGDEPAGDETAGHETAGDETADNDPAGEGASPVAGAWSRMRASRGEHPGFEVPDDVAGAWHQAGSRNASARRGWLKRLARHPQRAEFERVVAGRLPDTFHDALALLKAGIADSRACLAIGDASRRTLAALAPVMPELLGGAIEPAPAALPHLPVVAAGQYGGRSIRYGTREHGMAAAMNGMALHGGVVPFGAALFATADCMRPALRLAAAMRQRVVHVLGHDDRGFGEDGPGDQPAEQLASLRALPNLHVFRPADALEVAECWELALRRIDGPSVIALSGARRAPFRRDPAENRSARGGYLLHECAGPRQATLIATGAEVALACAARDLLAEQGIHVAVASLPCWELFARQDERYRGHVLGGVLRVGIEAASGFGWERWLGEGGLFIGVDGFGPSGASADVYKHLGITPEAIAAAIRRRLA